jgi:hypothetical protein
MGIKANNARHPRWLTRLVNQYPVPQLHWWTLPHQARVHQPGQRDKPHGPKTHRATLPGWLTPISPPMTGPVPP